MFYYELAIKGLFLDNLTFESAEKIANLAEVEVKLRNKLCTAFVLNECEKPSFKTSEILNITGRFLSKTQFELAKFIHYYYTTKLSFALSFFEPSVPYECEKIEISNTPNLSQNQNAALKFLKENQSALLFADTGSGKTEIYISLISEYLKKGKQVLLLMPEISLTPQMQKRLEKYFDDKFFLWHSKISKKAKNESLNALTNGKTLLIAGARSALFLPFSNLGLIIVDEEHDSSYKASNNPRINARDLALFLGQKMQIKVVLGSATPSLTSFYKQKSFRLKGTFFQSSKEFIYDNSDTKISPLLLNELEKTLLNKKQAVIFLPIKANFRQVLCKECGETIKCPFCSIALSLHKQHKALKCHYCGFIKNIDEFCPKCGANMLEARKIGTAELSEQLTLALSKYKPRIAKFDSDEITSVTRLNKILKDFNEAKIDFLVGTSMLAKGHDYHSVDLSVILGLDEYLLRPSFKAAEDTLALAMQVAGRAGRKGFARVLLQSKQEAFFKTYIENYDKFLEDELQNRAGLYPPFTRLLRIIIENKNQNKAKELCEFIAHNLKSVSNLEIIGFGKCAIELINAKFRFYILLRSNHHNALIKAANFASNFKEASADIDPIDFS